MSVYLYSLYDVEVEGFTFSASQYVVAINRYKFSVAVG